MLCERTCFFIESDASLNEGLAANSQAKPVCPKLWLCSYDFATDTKRQLVNVSAESGLHEMDRFSIARLDMRPVSANGLVGTSAKFLCTLEISNS